MKTLYSIIFSLLVTVSFSQMRGGGMKRGGHGRNGQGMQQQEMQGFNINRMAGIVMYDENKVLKKLKIKDLKKAQKIRTYIRDYNKKMEGLKLKYYKEIKTAKAMAEAKRKEAMQKQDREIMRDARSEIREKLAPVRNEAKQYQNLLNEKMEKILSEKKLKKWKKYVSSRHKKQSVNLSNNNSSNARRKGKGMGRMH